jgi:flavin-dependent dehydrogenase
MDSPAAVPGSTAAPSTVGQEPLRLSDRARVGVVGGGPAGSLFACFLLELSERMGLTLSVDLFEPRDFAVPGPVGCNMCGGIVSETLVQNLAAEGVTLPPGVVQRGIDAYVLHTDRGSVRIATPARELRIGAVYRGAGPRDAKVGRWGSFDGHLQAGAVARGAQVVKTRVEQVARDEEGRPTLTAKDGTRRTYDLLVVAAGINSGILKAFEGLGIGYERPRATKTLIREYWLGEEVIDRTLGNAMHVFLLPIPRLEFAAAIPKGEYVTMALLGEDVDDELVRAFVTSPQVRACMPPGWDPEARSCQCIPAINVAGAPKPYADRFLFIGDAGVTRLYKDGIGAAYRTAKAAATAAIFQGVSEEAFRRRFAPALRRISRDNDAGRFTFLLTRVARRFGFLRRGMLWMAREEQERALRPRMSGVLWDMFSGSSSYGDILRRMVSPVFLGRYLWAVVRSAVRRRPIRREGT